MYDEQMIFRENWPLNFYAAHIDSLEDFSATVQDEERFRTFVSEQMRAFCQQEEVDKKTYERIRQGITST